MKVENINFLSKYYRNIYELMNRPTKFESQKVKVSSAKNGEPIASVEKDGYEVSLHSKYDPIKESERVVKKYEQKLSEHKHIFLFGIGLGYHIELLTREFPEKVFYLFEPDKEVFKVLLETRDLSNIVNVSNCQLFVPKNEQDSRDILNTISEQLDEEILFIILPSYEKLYENEYQTTIFTFKQSLKNRKSNLIVNFAFQKRWNLNSVKNQRYTLNTANILAKSGDNPLDGKPVIIVAAGPSLYEELPIIKEIKSEGTAYIFAVGSANKVLIKNGIEPDAVCTYDPQGHNFKVFEEMIEREISHIPMIFGTSVGYETLEQFKGPKLFMITSQDGITPYFYDKDDYYTVEDAPSIAVITLQLLHYLNASHIILVGQNLAFRDGEFYAKGIEYEGRGQELSNKDMENQINVTSVTGKKLYTSEGFFRMKESIEFYVNKWNKDNVINTTTEGAEIKNVPYLPLSKVKEKYLQEKVVENRWFEKYNYEFKNSDNLVEKSEVLKKSYSNFENIIKDIGEVIQKISLYKNFSEQKVEKLFVKLDKHTRKMNNNRFYNLIIHPLMITERLRIEKAVKEIKLIKSIELKAIKISEHFGEYIQSIRTNEQYIQSAFLEMLHSFKK